jgi:hypothetical protein
LLTCENLTEFTRYDDLPQPVQNYKRPPASADRKQLRQPSLRSNKISFVGGINVQTSNRNISSVVIGFAQNNDPVCSKPAQESRLDSDREALAGTALHAFESAHIITRCGRFDLGQPHGVAALGARKDSDFSPAVEWIAMGGWHDARLRSGGSAKLSVTGNCRQGAVIEPACSPSSGAAGQYCSLFQIVRGRTAPPRWVSLRPPIDPRVTARDIRNGVDHIWLIGTGQF